MEPTIKENIPNKVTKPKNGIPWITQEIVKKKKKKHKKNIKKKKFRKKTHHQETIPNIKNQTTVILKTNIKI